MVFIGCERNNTPKAGQPIEAQSLEYYRYLNVYKWKQEYLYPDSVLINGKIPVHTTKQALMKLLGPPTQKFKLAPGHHFFIYFNRSTYDSIYVYKNSYFITKNDQIKPYVINFEDNLLYLTAKGERLDTQFDLKKLSIMFPETSKLIRVEGNAITGYLGINADRSEMPHHIWELLFQHDQLVGVCYRPSMP